MAETLEAYNFLGNHGNAIYPWAEWGDGRIVKITKGIDFSVDAPVMRGQVIVRARKESLLFKTNVRGDDVVFTFQGAGESPEAFEARTSGLGLE